MSDLSYPVNPPVLKEQSSRLPDKLFIIFSLLFFSLPQTTIGVSANQVIVHFLMISIVFSVAIYKIGPLIKTLLSDKMLFAVILYILISITWSAAPLATAIFLLKFITSTLFAVYVSSKYTLESFFNFLVVFLITSAILSLMAGILLPGYTIHTGVAHAGAWMGIYGHKNGLGTMCVLGISAMLIWFFSTPDKIKKIISVAGLGLSISLLVLSTSRTAIVVSIVCAIIPVVHIGYRKLFRIHRSIFISSIIFGIVALAGAVYLVTVNLNSIFALMDRNPDLTGRTEIWAVVMTYIKERVWLGYGYGGFWNSGYAVKVWDTLQYPLLGSSHSGLYDLLLDFGAIGLMIISIQYLFLLGRAIKLSFIKRGQGKVIWFLIFTLFMLINNYSDSRFLNTTSIYWVLYVCTSILMKKSYDSRNEVL